MKTKNLFLSALALVGLFLSSCEKSPVTTEDGSSILFENGTQLGNGDQEYVITGSHTIKKGTYTLKGWVYVAEGAQLTIEPGTVIKGDKTTKAALIVKPGGKLIADGTQTEPIVFTSAQAAGSRKPGDWGGIIMCGNAKNNQGTMMIEGGPNANHGGNNDDDNSGILRYVRIEYAGYPLQTDQEINGLTMGSVGRGTTIEYVQVSYCNDDSYEWFGGTVNAKYLIAYHGWDDDFDTDNGFSGNVQFALSVRHPKLADTSRSNGFESDNKSDAAATAPFTSPLFSNVTMVGPIGQDVDFVNNSTFIDGGQLNPNNGSKLGVFQASMQIRRNSKLNCFNSVTMGFPVGLIIENDKSSTTQDWFTNNEAVLKNIVFAGMADIASDSNGKVEGKFSKKYATDNFEIKENISDLGLNQPNSLLANANWGPKSGSMLVGRTGLFSDSKFTGNSFFKEVDYIGAFASDSDSDNWTKGWANFDPQNASY